jgi:hypothetical protein
MTIVMISILAAMLLALSARALSANSPPTLDVGEFNDFPVLASATIYEGSMVGLSSGYARALVAGDRFVGHAFAKVIETTAVNGGATVKVRTGRYRMKVAISSVAVTDVGKYVYASDDGTYTLVPTAYSPVGKVHRYDSSGYAIVEFRPTDPAGELAASAVAASSAITNTVTETAFSTGSKTLDGTQLRVGDVIRVRLQGIATATNSTDTLTVKLYLGTEEIVTTGAVDVADNDIFFIDCDIVVRTIGASGAIVACGLVGLGVEGTVTAKPFKKASATEDISGSVAVAAKATWSVAHAGNSCRLDVFNVQVLKA